MLHIPVSLSYLNWITIIRRYFSVRAVFNHISISSYIDPDYKLQQTVQFFWKKELLRRFQQSNRLARVHCCWSYPGDFLLRITHVTCRQCRNGLRGSNFGQIRFTLPTRPFLFPRGSCIRRFFPRPELDNCFSYRNVILTKMNSSLLRFRRSSLMLALSKI